MWTQASLRWQGRAQCCKGVGVQSKNHQLHLPLQEHLKLIATKPLELNPLIFADFLEVLLPVAGPVACKQCGLELS